jgi:GLPGLI family protein
MIMKATPLFFICIFLFGGTNVFAQNKHFITAGTIEFERTANMFALVKKKITPGTPELKPIYERFVKTEPQFRKLKSTLTFGGHKTLFVPVAPEKEVAYDYDTPMADQNNIVFNDMNTGTSVIQKEFFERRFLVKDTIRKINWKITGETREIAGHTCRRANALVLDSIYVVAFYTDEIHVQGGPESFNGLPGMILGVAVPHENVTWFATKVTEMPVDAKSLMPPTKGKPVNNKQLYDAIMATVGNWGEYYIVVVKGYLL